MTMIKREFSILRDGELNRTVHIHKCTINEMLINLMLFNDRMIEMIGKAMLRVKPDKYSEYRRGLTALILLQLSRKVKGRPVKISLQVPVLFHRLQLQQQEIKKLITGCMKINLNKKKVNFIPMGIFRISIGDAIEYLLLCQNHYLVMARQILMLQNL